MGTSASTLFLVLSFSVGQSTMIDQEDHDFQDKVYQQWWGTDFEWKFSELPTEARVAETRKPYSGYIYPDQAGGTVSAMRKYDLAFNSGNFLATAHERRDTSVTETTMRPMTYTRRFGLFGRGQTVTEMRMVTGVPHWYGHCNGWTSATIRHAEPQKSVERNGVVFSPADIKGLLAEIYMYNEEQMLAGDGTAINPGTFHAILTNWLGRGLHPIGMDSDPGKEKWNYPIYAYTSTSYERSPREIEVAVNIAHTMSSQGEFDRSPRIKRIKYFHYNLSLDEEGKIVGGWYYRDSSRIDMLWVPLRPKQGGQKGNERGNPHLDVKEVLAIWRQSVPDDLRKNWKIINPPNYIPAITSENTASIGENQQPVLTVTATDEDLEQPLEFVTPQTLSFSLEGGADQALFTIEEETGALTFNQAPDFEKPADRDKDNVYEVAVRVDDGADGSVTQQVSVTVTDVNDAPMITSESVAMAAENELLVGKITAIDEDLPAQALTLSLVGGMDQRKFSINAETGELSFATAPDFERSGDADNDRVYEVEVRVEDGQGSTATRLLRVTVTDANDTPTITSTPSPSILENQLAVLTITSTDEDFPPQTRRYTMNGGSDEAKFHLDSTTGALSFRQDPNFESPEDTDQDNRYELEVQVDDGAGGVVRQALTVTVGDANDRPVITSSPTRKQAENGTNVLTATVTDEDFPRQPCTFSLSGGADRNLFSVEATTGELSFNSAPNYEKPGDANSDNVYDVEFKASDGMGGEVVQLVNVTVTDGNDNPAITSANTSTAAENERAAMKITAHDEDVPKSSLQFSLLGGVDRSNFTIHATSGELAFNTLPNYEQPADANGDNVYEVEVRVADGAGGTAVQMVSVQVCDANDNPLITFTPKVVENQTPVLKVNATDEDLTSEFTALISGGADRAMFTMDGKSGDLAFKHAPDFEKPKDADQDNVYEVEVSVTDGADGRAVQLIKVAVTDVKEEPIDAAATTSREELESKNEPSSGETAPGDKP